MFANNSRSRLRKNVNPTIFPSLEGSSNDTALPEMDSTRSRKSGTVTNMDQRTQTAPCLSERSPRKIKLRKILKQLRNEADYLKKKTTSLKKTSLNPFLKILWANITYKFCPSAELVKFINVQVSQITKKPGGRRYSPGFKNTQLYRKKNNKNVLFT
nr:unnamed protein product [Callosobruchus analis]